MENDNPNKSFKVCKHTFENPDKSTSSEESYYKKNKDLLKQYKYADIEETKNLLSKYYKKVNRIDLEEEIQAEKKQMTDNAINSKLNHRVETTRLDDGTRLVWNKVFQRWVPITENENGEPLESNYNEDRDPYDLLDRRDER